MTSIDSNVAGRRERAAWRTRRQNGGSQMLRAVCRIATFVIATVTWLFISSAASADSPPADRPPPGHTRTLSVPQAGATPVIDGVLDDDAWKNAAVADRFWISEQERWPTERTEVLVTADREHLYFAFRAYDSQPDRIEALQTRRDASLGLDDQVFVELDPYLSHREVSTYGVNAAGTQSDALAGGRARQRSWKGEWRGAASRTPYGWSAEIAIPFSILNYEDASTVFGVNFVRYHHRTTEWSRWADVTVRNLPEEMGRLSDVQPQGGAKARTWTFMPYALVGKNVPNKEGVVKSTLATGGADIRYEPRQNLTAVLSLNPDFSQVESAITDIDFNYNEKFLSENRPFFQEGAAYFGKAPAYFYSNRIPDFNYGAKLFSRAGGYQLGALATRAPDRRTDFALRLQREFDASHSLAAMAVGTDQPALRNILYVASGQGREASGFNYGFDGALTRTQGQPGDGSFVQGTVGWQRDFLSIGVTANRYSTEYSPANALLAADLPDTRGVTSFASLYRDFGPGPIREVTGSLVWQTRDTGDGRLQRNYLYGGGSVELRQQVKFSLSGTGGQYRPVGGAPGLWSDAVNHDHYWTLGVDMNTRSSRFAYGASYSSGILDSTDYRYGYVYAWVRPTATTFVNVTAERLRQFGTYEQIALNGGWDITPRHGLYGRYIWNDGSQYRLAYTFHVTERVDFFAVLDALPGQDTQVSAKILVTLP